MASTPLDAHKPPLEQILRHGQKSGELRRFNIEVMAGLRRSAVTAVLDSVEAAQPLPN